MAKNFLLIGLGGTGCAVVRELKKSLYIEWRSRGNTGMPPEIYTFEEKLGGQVVSSKIATLSMDSNEADLEGQGERARKWRVFGETLSLGDREKVLVSPTGIHKILDNLQRYTGVEPWVKDEIEFVRDITRGCSGPAGCNQIRRMGRLALANGKNIENVISAISNRINELSGKGGNVGAEIHIACTLAAGTGSGTVLDVVAQLQRYLQNQPGDFNVYIHGFVTAKDVGTINTGNFYANQYGALTELNAFRLGNYTPWDIMGPARPERIQLKNTFRSVALISETTERGTSVALEQQIENAAEFIFQLSVRQMGDMPNELRQALTMEDRDQYPADVDGGNRSTAFISYGVQRIAIPEKEIREKLAYSFGRQVVLKILYNNWDGCFLPNARSFSANDFVDTRRENWRVTREHLYLDRVEEAIGQATHPSYEIEWREELVRQETRVKEQLGDAFEARQRWLTDFDRRAEAFWENGFRAVGAGGGVENYFANRRDPMTLRSRARDIRAIVETALLEGMERGDQKYVLYYLPDALDILLDRIAQDSEHFGELAEKAKKQIDESDHRREETKREYLKCGRFSGIIGNKPGSLFNQYREASTRYYYWRTISLAAQYGQEFCAALTSELKSLNRQVVLFKSRLLLVAKNFEAEMHSRIVESKEESSKEEVDYLVDAKYVNAMIHERFECNKSVQDHHALTTTEALAQLRQNRAEFAAYTEIMPVDNSEQVGGPLVDELRRVADRSAGEAHRRIREEDKDFHGIFGQNIIQKLYNDYGGQVNDEMLHWLREIMSKAMPMVSFEANEESMDLGSNVRAPVLRRCVFIPKCKAVPQQFSQDLRQTIESITGDLKGGGVVETYCQDIPEDRNSSEISILSVAFFFPARFTHTVHGLQEEYRKRLDQLKEKDARRAYFEVHTESHRPRLPNLMKQGRTEVLTERFSTVLLATVLGLMYGGEKADEQIVFGTEEAHSTGGDMVESGMYTTTELLEKIKALDNGISFETFMLHSLYLTQFAENCLDAVESLVVERCKEGDKIPNLEEDLKKIRNDAFLLSHKKRDDETFILFKESVKDAIEQWHRLTEELV
ncbi:MAG: tubulin-like doman-containing protein [Candidatus Electrothrix aestuarii]|uniref:Tubulin-like doman-containing protein n=1 Tax=Candidatus Electrothrix aestuarii TaxID=3062594 RepID=A0AAU8M0B0_9BACT|nr:tubulin-like doman-containing protein [Candidatus Electrothrix aestuarii]